MPKRSTIELSLVRTRGPSASVFWAEDYAILAQLGDDVFEILFVPHSGNDEMIRVVFDASIWRGNLLPVKRYLQKVDFEPRQTSSKSYGASKTYFSNMLLAAFSGDRAEIAFGIISLNDWADGIKMGSKSGATDDPAVIEWKATLSVYSEIGLQGRLLSDLIERTSTESEG